MTPRFTSILKSVSRSIYLSVRVLPGPVRLPIGMGYLFARAADSIADTRLLPAAQRLKYLETFRRQFDRPDEAQVAAIGERLTPHQAVPGERELLRELPALFSRYRSSPDRDRALIRELMSELPEGMRLDLETFPPEDSGRVAALARDEDLERYCYLVAGTAGRFWTRVLHHRAGLLDEAQLEPMIEKGVRYGKGLQLINILRDIPRDLRIGRCYLPAARLRQIKLAPEELLDPAAAPRARPVLHDLIRRALEGLEAGRDYCLALPRLAARFRLASLWPLLIGLKTLAALAREPNWLAPEVTVRIPRRVTRRLVLGSIMRVTADRSLQRLTARLFHEVRAALA